MISKILALISFSGFSSIPVFKDRYTAFIAFKDSTEILLSGFLINDEQNVINTFNRLGYKYHKTVIRNEWASILLIKS